MPYKDIEKRRLKDRENYEKNWPRYILKTVKTRAKKKNREFNLTEEDLIVPELCPVFEEPLNIREYKQKGGTPFSPSVDRIDNNKGYIKGNMQIISFLANSMKSSASPSQLIKFAKWILRTYTQKS
jgi:hypothetical protein